MFLAMRNSLSISQRVAAAAADMLLFYEVRVLMLKLLTSQVRMLILLRRNMEFLQTCEPATQQLSENTLLKGMFHLKLLQSSFKRNHPSKGLHFLECHLAHPECLARSMVTS